MQQACTPQQFAIVRHVAIDMNNNMVSKSNRVAARTLRQLKFEPVRSDEPVLRATLPPEELRLTIGSLFVDSLGRLVPASDHEDYLRPLGFQVRRVFWGIAAPPCLSTYLCRVVGTHQLSECLGLLGSPVIASAGASCNVPPERRALLMDACRSALHKYGVFEFALNAATGELQVLERLESIIKSEGTGAAVVSTQPPPSTDSGLVGELLDPLLTAGTVSVLATATVSSVGAPAASVSQQQSQTQSLLETTGASFLPPTGAQLNGGGVVYAADQLEPGQTYVLACPLCSQIYPTEALFNAHVPTCPGLAAQQAAQQTASSLDIMNPLTQVDGTYEINTTFKLIHSWCLERFDVNFM